MISTMMSVMTQRLLVSFIFVMTGTASAAVPIAALSDYKGFVKLNEEKEFYVNYVKAKEGQPTVILMNGLTYSTRQWDTMVAALLQYGVGVVRFDFDGMGETLLRYAPALRPFQIEDQAKNLKLLLTSMGLKGPYNFAGLSYGGGALAKYTELYPNDVGQMIMMAPFTEPLAEQDELILKNVQWNKIMFPFNPASDDELYDYFLRQIIYATYPAVEPLILENPFKLEAAFRLVQGIRKFKAIEVTHKIPARKLHLMIALRDQYIKQNVLDKYWDATPEASRASRIYIRDSEHKIPESVPAFAAYWVYRIISNDEALLKGSSFIGNPHDNTAQIIQ